MHEGVRHNFERGARTLRGNARLLRPLNPAGAVAELWRNTPTGAARRWTPRPPKLAALDAEDLAIIPAHLQASVLKVRDLVR